MKLFIYIRELCIFNNRRSSTHIFTYRMIIYAHTEEWKIVTYYYSEIIFIRLRFQLISANFSYSLWMFEWLNEWIDCIYGSMNSSKHSICAIEMVIIKVSMTNSSPLILQWKYLTWEKWQFLISTRHVEVESSSYCFVFFLRKGSLQLIQLRCVM